MVEELAEFQQEMSHTEWTVFNAAAMRLGTFFMTVPAGKEKSTKENGTTTTKLVGKTARGNTTFRR